MADFANDDIISSAGGDSAGTYSYPKSGGEAFYAGNYFLSVMGTWDGNTIDVRVKDRSGNYFVPNDASGSALSGKTANFGAVVSLAKAGIDIVLAGSGSQELTVTLEPWPY